MFLPYRRLEILAALTALTFAPALGAQTPKKKDPPKVEGRLIVVDGGGLFTPEAIKKAKAAMTEVRDTASRELHIVTFKEVPEARKKEFEKLEMAARAPYYLAWARAEAKNSEASGVFVFILRSPGHIVVISDMAVKAKGFAAVDEERVRDLFLEKLREAAKTEKEEDKATLRDKSLLNATEFVRDAYKKMAR